MRDFRPTVPNLAALRERHGIGLNQIAQSTKINLSYLHAIERGDLRKLPEGVYTRSYIRQYARAIDFNEHDLLAACGLTDRIEATPARLPSPEPRGLLLRCTAFVAHAWQLARGGRVDAG